MYDAPACATVDPELFFPAYPVGWKVTTAKRICGYCPHAAECLEDNLGVPFGIFGGLTHQERETVRKRRGLTAEKLSPLPDDSKILAQRVRRERERLERVA